MLNGKCYSSLFFTSDILLLTSTLLLRTPSSRAMWLVCLCIGKALPIALGILRFIITPLSTEILLTNKVSISAFLSPLEELATAELSNLSIGAEARLGKYVSWAL